MSKSAAFGFLMWMGGTATGIGLTGPNYSLTACGVLLSLSGIFYYRKFVDAE